MIPFEDAVAVRPIIGIFGNIGLKIVKFV